MAAAGPSLWSQTSKYPNGMSIETEYNLECWQLDYSTAFRYADVEEKVYVKMAPGYERLDENEVPMVMRLLKSFHDLRQSSLN